MGAKMFCESPRVLKEALESRNLSPYAQLAAESRGRRIRQDECEMRTVYERDTGRIIYSREFRRLRQKTQVFFNPRNDHICTRMEHVIYVNYIAATIGKALRLNTDLIQAIALGHDLGHAPFGHTGETVLRACLKKLGVDFSFQHELHSLRVVDQLAELKGGWGLNLTFEVRDGIVSHCGERYHEYCLRPWRDKREEDLIPGAQKHRPPASLEGCVVRMADKIAYVGRDIEDAARAGLMDFADIPKDIRELLGTTNSELINSLVTDIIQQSYDQDYISLSDAYGEALEELLHDNMKHIYSSEKIEVYEQLTEHILTSLFWYFYEAGQDPEKLAASEEEAQQAFATFLAKHPEPESGLARKLTDYLAGMTDHFARQTFDSIFLV